MPEFKESYSSVESRIQEAITKLLQRADDENPDLAAAPQDFDLPPQ